MARSHSTKALRLQDDGLAGGDAQAGCHRRGARRHPVGERPPEAGASEHRGRGPGHPVLVETERQLEEYFAGRRKAFALTLDVAGTPFQRKVWNALLTIPFGETRSYGEIARQIGSPDAVRAVGAANGRNPVSIVAPCHRVIGATGKLTGFAGGLEVKARLLALEGAMLAETEASTRLPRGELKQPIDQICRHLVSVRLVHQLVACFMVELRRNRQPFRLDTESAAASRPRRPRQPGRACRK